MNQAAFKEAEKARSEKLLGAATLWLASLYVLIAFSPWAIWLGALLALWGTVRFVRNLPRPKAPTAELPAYQPRWTHTRRLEESKARMAWSAAFTAISGDLPPKSLPVTQDEKYDGAMDRLFESVNRQIEGGKK